MPTKKKSKGKSNGNKKATVKRKTPSVDDYLEKAADAIVEYEVNVDRSNFH